MKRKIYFISFFICVFLIFFFVFIFYSVKYPLKYKDEILFYSQEYNLKPELVASLIEAESSFNEKATSSSGAIGLMQILPSTGKYIAGLLNDDFEKMNLYEPKTNIKYGCFYLNYLTKKFNTEREILCAYNAGETIVLMWLKNDSLSEDGKLLKEIPYKVTKNYTEKIIKNKKYYLNRF